MKKYLNFNEADLYRFFIHTANSQVQFGVPCVICSASALATGNTFNSDCASEEQVRVVARKRSESSCWDWELGVSSCAQSQVQVQVVRAEFATLALSIRSFLIGFLFCVRFTATRAQKHSQTTHTRS